MTIPFDDNIDENYIKDMIKMTQLWFVKDLKEIFNIDVFSKEFDKVKGYQIYSNEYSDVMLMKCERINDVLIEAIKVFLDIDIREIKQSNKTASKKTGDVYKEIKNTIKFSESVLEQFYNLSIMRLCYTDDEIAEFIQEWITTETTESTEKSGE